MKIYLNDKLVPKEDAKISVFDHGFLYGDGVFEGIRIYSGCVYKLEEHLERLEYSARAICLDLPWTRAEISKAVCDTCRANGLRDGYIRLVISRGEGTLGLDPRRCPKPNLVIIADKIQLYPESLYTEGLKLITVPTRRLGTAQLPPMIKSLNYLNNILAKIEANHLGYQEAIMLNEQGNVAECTGDNIFIAHKGRILTPASSAGALRGITRDSVLEIAKELGVELVECDMTRYDLWIADECFLTGSAAELIPVTEIDGRRVGNGKPGPLFAKFLKAFRSRVATQGTML